MRSHRAAGQQRWLADEGACGRQDRRNAVEALELGITRRLGDLLVGLDRGPLLTNEQSTTWSSSEPDGSIWPRWTAVSTSRTAIASCAMMS